MPIPRPTRFNGSGVTEFDTRVAALAGRLRPNGVDLAAITADPPTVTNGVAATISGRVENANSENLSPIGRRGSWVSGATDVDGAYTGREFYANGDVEFSWKARGTNSGRFLFFVDGLPVAVAPSAAPGTTTAGATYYMKLAWAVARRRKITILAARISAWGAFRFAATTSVQAAAPRPVVTFVGASFDAGWTTADNTSALEGVAAVTAQLLGVDTQIAAQESTGFVAVGATQTYGDAARIARGTERTPELVVFTGSGNDLDLGTTVNYSIAVKNTFDLWASALPGVPFIVFGIPPRAATGTLADNIADRNHALREVAVSHPSVIAFIDMLGVPTGTAVPAYSTVKADYQPGDLVAYLGSVWQLAPHIVGSTPANAVPGTSERWMLATWVMSGTGKVGTTTGDGTRDVLLSTDGTHPRPEGLIALAQRADDAIRSILQPAV